MPIAVRLALVLLTALFLSPAAANAQVDSTDPTVDPAQCADQGTQAEETEEEYAARLCAPRKPGREQCAPGRGRKTAGGGNTGNVSHKGWPAITGILWKVTERAGTHSKTGGDRNDELLGHHGNDTVVGLGG